MAYGLSKKKVLILNITVRQLSKMEHSMVILQQQLQERYTREEMD